MAQENSMDLDRNRLKPALYAKEFCVLQSHGVE